MRFIQQARIKVGRWPYSAVSLLAALAAFGCYTSMYAFRKAFSAGTFEAQQELWQVDYKVWLVIAQVVGYTISKFYGIRFVSEVVSRRRAPSILVLIGIAWFALLGFAVIPAPWNILFLFLNGLPLGMIWGLVFSYLEGRRSTEFMAAVMAVSMVFASGLVKTVGRTLIGAFQVSEYWMPFLTGLLFVLPLLLFVACLELVPPPDEQDVRLRARRSAMNTGSRKKLLRDFFPGLCLTVAAYLVLTVMRDIRDNFEVEIWAGMGVAASGIYAKVDSLIALLVLALMSLLILVRDNLTAFTIIHCLILAGCLLFGGTAFLFSPDTISPALWMTATGLGLYMAYIPYNAIFFERMIASFRVNGNVGFVMYIADAMGYLGSVSMLLVKELGVTEMSWGDFFRQGGLVIGLFGSGCVIASLCWFRYKAILLRKEAEREETPVPNLNYSQL